MNRTKIVVIIFGLTIVFGICFFIGYKFFVKQGPRRSMHIEQTLAIVKPDAVRAHHTGKIIDRIEREGFTILDLRKVHVEREQAEQFYQEHRGKKFFHDLIDSSISGPIVVMILEKINALADWRDIIGATNPAQAKEGTLRKQFGIDTGRNAVHGSDSPEAAKREILFFFADRRK